jgi:hypothetical protein
MVITGKFSRPGANLAGVGPSFDHGLHETMKIESLSLGFHGDFRVTGA